MRVRRTFLFGLVLGLAGVTGCAPASGTPAEPGAPAEPGGPGATESGEPCVADVAAVIGTPPTTASTTDALPASTLDDVARAAFTRVAAPGAIVGVRTPAGTWTAAYGLADPTNGQAMTTEMYTRIGSVTMTFTGTVILQLVEDGQLSASDTIDRYYPGIPNGYRITLGHLATMTSGIAGYYTDEFLTRYFGDPESALTPDQLIGYGVSASPLFEPGARYGYSNTNTLLLGAVIEKVTGQPVRDVFAQRIFAPLGLTHTSLPDGSSELPSPHPQGYTLQGRGTPANPANATNWSPSSGWTAGGMVSTVSDLLTYDRALATGQGLVSAATQTQRLTSFPSPAGYGFALGCRDGWVGHSGELPGFDTAVYHDTTSDTSVVVLVNSGLASGDCSLTLTDNQADGSGCSPATRIFVALSAALGHTFRPLRSK